MNLSPFTPVPATVGGRTGGKSIITQSMLQDFLDLKAQIPLHDTLRRDIIALLAAGAVVEPGPLDADTKHVTLRALTGPNLIPLLGEDEVRRLKAEVAPIVQIHLIVRERTDHGR